MREGAVHVVALFVRHHLQRQLVVVAQEDGPLADGRQLRRLREDVDDWQPVLHVHRHEDSRHDRKMEIHVALVAVAEVLGGVLGPLIRLREQHAVLEALIDVGAKPLEERVRLGEVLAVGAVPLVQVRHRVQP